MSEDRLNRFVEAYKNMAKQARYRPAAPGDGVGHVTLTEKELADSARLDKEAAAYAKQFYRDDDALAHNIGCSNFRTNRALVYTIEAARSLCGAADDVAIDLLNMAIAEINAQKTD